MTKYVLHSGGSKRYPQLRQQFHLELIKGLGDRPRVLLCIFAQPREDWETKFPGYARAINDDMPAGVTPTFKLAMPADFAQQCQAADIIFIYGGDDHLLQYWMRQFKISELFADKVVASTSAGSDMLATHYWTCDWRQCGDGLAVLPVKFIPHYQSDFGADDPRGPIDWARAREELAGYGDTSLPIHALPEGQYLVVGQ